LRRAEVAYGLACTSDAAFTVTLGVVAFREGGAGAVGLVALLRMLPSALGSTVLTAYADRLRRERVLVVASVVRAGALAATAVLLAAGAPAATIYLLAVVVTAAMTIFRPVHSALQPLLCTDTTELTSANVVRGVLEAVATLAGPVLAGIVLVVASPSAAFGTVAAVTVLSVVPLLGIVSDAPPSEPTSGRRVAKDAVEGVRVVAAHRDLRLVFGLGFAQTIVRGALNVFIVVVAFDLLGTDDSGVATLAAALGVGGLVGSFGASLLVGSRHLGAWLSIALALWGLPIVAMGAVSRQLLDFGLIAVVGVANALIDVPLFTLPVRLVSDAVLARAFGIFEALIALGVGLGSVASPVLIAVAGLRPAMAATGLLLPLLAVLRWRRLHTLDDQLVVRDDEIAVLRSTPLLALLPVPAIEHLASRLRRETVPAGANVFLEGQRGDRVYVVIDGTAEVLGKDRLVATVGPGGAFGEIAVLRDVPRTATVRAATDLDLFALARDDFLTALGRHQPSSDAAYASVARQMAAYRPAGFGP
jgi:MFS family permease